MTATDEGISGTSVKHRDGFKKMIAEAKEGKVDLIITKEVSRFARNTVDVLNYTRELKAIGVGVIFMNDGIDTREPDGELRLTIMASIAQEESRKTSERVKWGQKRRMEQGVVFGRDLLGYRVIEGKLVINAEEAEIVRLIFHKYLYEGKGMARIARELEEAHISAMRGNRCNNVVIQRILNQEKYCGDLLQKKTRTPNYLDHKKKYNRGEEDMVYIKDHHEPIIEREMWDKVQEQLKLRSLRQSDQTKYSNRYWCSGKVYCGECGDRYVSRKRTLKNEEVRKTWQCYALCQYGKKHILTDGSALGCDNTAVNQRIIDRAIKFILESIQINIDELKLEMLNELDKTADSMEIKDTDEYYKKINALEEKKKGLIDLMLENIISKDEWVQQKQYYDDSIKGYRSKIVEAEKYNARYQNIKTQHEQYGKALDDILSFDTDSEAVYKEMVDKIIVYADKRLEVYLQGIPLIFCLTYATSGKMEYYQVDFVLRDVKNIDKSE